jgi:hypothetical protein
VLIGRRRWIAWIGCVVRGHDDLAERTGRTVRLRCQACRRATRGWRLDATPPTRRYPADRWKLRIPRRVRLRAVGE